MDVSLVLFKKDGSRKAFLLPSSVTVIGRRSDCDLYIPLMPISRRHCQLSHNEGVLKIRDLGSRNGTYLNGKRISEAVIQAGDYIKVGPLMFVFQIDGQPENIIMPNAAMQQSPKEDISVDDLTAEEFDSLKDSGSA